MIGSGITNLHTYLVDMNTGRRVSTITHQESNIVNATIRKLNREIRSTTVGTISELENQKPKRLLIRMINGY